MIYRLEEQLPLVAGSAYVAPQACLIGDVRLAERASVWFNAVLRADNDAIRVGEASNVQDGAVLHVDRGYPLTIGAHVTIGHQAMLHGCTIGDGTLIGSQAVVLNGAVIGPDCLVGAGALVGEGKAFPARSLIVGAPARVVRELTAEQIAGLRANADEYLRRAERYRRHLQAASGRAASAV